MRESASGLFDSVRLEGFPFDKIQKPIAIENDDTAPHELLCAIVAAALELTDNDWV